jgi:hypothetical protein
MIELTCDEPMCARIVLVEAQTCGPNVLERHGKTLAEGAAFLRGGREFGAAAGKLPENAEDSAVSGLAWLLQSRLVRGPIEDAGRLREQVTQLALEPYVGRRQAERAAKKAPPSNL